MVRNVIIVDIDGTIADCSHRLHFIEKHPKNWESFHDQAIVDPPILSVINLVQALAAQGAQIAFVTGRPESHREILMNWLSTHGLPAGALYMRKTGDYRMDTVIKSEIFAEHFSEKNIWFVLEDRSSVVKMWRNIGLKVLQVADGNY